jgi:hypothetical protein
MSAYTQHLQNFESGLKDSMANKDHYKQIVMDKVQRLSDLSNIAGMEGDEKKQAIAGAVGGISQEVGSFNGAIARAKDFNTTLHNGKLLRSNVKDITDALHSKIGGLTDNQPDNLKSLINNGNTNEESADLGDKLNNMKSQLGNDSTLNNLTSALKGKSTLAQPVSDAAANLGGPPDLSAGESARDQTLRGLTNMSDEDLANTFIKHSNIVDDSNKFLSDNPNLSPSDVNGIKENITNSSQIAQGASDENRARQAGQAARDASQASSTNTSKSSSTNTSKSSSTNTSKSSSTNTSKSSSTNTRGIK